MSTFKTYGAVAVMVCCFAIVYPRFMHPMIFGSGDGARKDSNTNYPPGYKGERGSSGGGAHPEDVRKHMRHGPHPGMRAAAEMQRQQSAQGSGRGMMGVVLPMYAVGIVLYLGYTLYKVFNKTSAKTGGTQRYAWDKTSRYSREKDKMGFPQDYDGRTNDGRANAEIRNFLHDQEHRQNLEDLLTRVDDKNVSVDEMKVLQKRLEETEAQMTRILQAMRGVNDGVDNLATGEPGEDLSPETGAAEDNKSVPVVGESTDLEGTPKNHDDKDGAETETTEPMKEVEQEDGKNSGDDDDSCKKEEEEEGIEGDEEEEVDEMMDDGKGEDVDEDDNASSSVRQRNVKANEQ